MQSTRIFRGKLRPNAGAWRRFDSKAVMHGVTVNKGVDSSTVNGDTLAAYEAPPFIIDSNNAVICRCNEPNNFLPTFTLFCCTSP